MQLDPLSDNQYVGVVTAKGRVLYSAGYIDFQKKIDSSWVDAQEVALFKKDSANRLVLEMTMTYFNIETQKLDTSKIEIELQRLTAGEFAVLKARKVKKGYEPVSSD